MYSGTGNAAMLWNTNQAERALLALCRASSPRINSILSRCHRGHAYFHSITNSHCKIFTSDALCIVHHSKECVNLSWFAFDLWTTKVNLVKPAHNKLYWNPLLMCVYTLQTIVSLWRRWLFIKRNIGHTINMITTKLRDIVTIKHCITFQHSWESKKPRSHFTNFISGSYKNRKKAMRRDRAISEIIIIGIRSTVQKQGSIDVIRVFLPFRFTRKTITYSKVGWWLFTKWKFLSAMD